MLPSIPLWKNCTKTKSMISHTCTCIWQCLYNIYEINIILFRTDTQKISPILETENILTYVDDQTIPLHYQGNKST